MVRKLVTYYFQTGKILYDNNYVLAVYFVTKHVHTGEIFCQIVYILIRNQVTNAVHTCEKPSDKAFTYEILCDKSFTFR